MNDKEIHNLSLNTFDLLVKHPYPIIRYFQLTLSRYLILLKILEVHYAKEKITQEKLIMCIPSNISSRSNSMNILKNITERNYVSKEKSKIDSRSITIVPNLNLLNEYKQFIELTRNTIPYS